MSLRSSRYYSTSSVGSTWLRQFLAEKHRHTQDLFSEHFLGNPFKLKPNGSYERDESVLKHYRKGLLDKMTDQSEEVSPPLYD
jgi:hypothetical protein